MHMYLSGLLKLISPPTRFLFLMKEYLQQAIQTFWVEGNEGDPPRKIHASEMSDVPLFAVLNFAHEC